MPALPLEVDWVGRKWGQSLLHQIIPAEESNVQRSGSAADFFPKSRDKWKPISLSKSNAIIIVFILLQKDLFVEKYVAGAQYQCIKMHQIYVIKVISDQPVASGYVDFLVLLPLQRPLQIRLVVGTFGTTVAALFPHASPEPSAMAKTFWEVGESFWCSVWLNFCIHLAPCFFHVYVY